MIGRNGAGKTSLLSLIASFQLPTSGTIKIDGMEAFENEEKMEEVIFIYPSDYAEDTDTVSDKLDMVRSFKPNYDEEYANKLIKKFNLPKDKPINELSKGMQSAVNVTIGLSSRSPITIFDEAYLSMDAPSRELFYDEVLEDQTKYPRLFILSTHLVSEAEYLFDEVAILNKGKLIQYDNYETIVSQGATVTGTAEIVEEFVKTYKQLDEKELGGVKAVTIYGRSVDELQEKAISEQIDVEISPISLQTLFNRLTEESENFE